MKRLGKQRVETLQILNSLTFGKGWKNHPAVRMWEGHRLALIDYGIAICNEWSRRGYRDTCLEKIKSFRDLIPSMESYSPKFVGNKEFHRSHMSNLLRKNKEYYSKYFKNVPDDLPYLWILN